MRILYHHRTQAEDGQAVHIRALIRAFEEAGHEVYESGLVKHGRAPSPSAAASADDAAGGRSKWGWITRMPRFARELAEYGYNGVARNRLASDAVKFAPDFLYERYAFGNAAGVLVARRLRLPMVLEVNSPMVLELERTRGLSFPNFARKVEAFVFGAADRVCVVTAVLRDMLIEMGVAPERLVVTPNGVHLAAYDHADRDAVRRAARVDLELPEEIEGEVVIGFVGYYRDWHRLDVVLDAMREGGLERARLVLIGEGPARESLEAHARKVGVAERVTFAGTRPHDRIPALLPAFDVGVVPAINPYASPLKLHEYMAASLPVVAPDQDNLREVLTHDANGLLVPPGEPDAMADAVLQLARDAVLRERLGRAARATVVDEDLTWAGNVRRVLAAIEPVISASKTSAGGAA